MKKTPLKLTIGSDPELMLLDSQRNKIVSSLRILKQTKEFPIILGDDTKMYADNVLVEASFPPISLGGDMISHLRNVFVKMQERLGARYKLLPQSSHVYEDNELKYKVTKPDGKKVTAWDIGCNPNYDVYNRRMNLPAEFENGLRTGSFHLHLGNEAYQTDREGKLMSMPNKEEAIKIMDVFVGCASVLFDNDKTSAARRKYYGKAGEFRPTPYGVEYRVLGNFSLRSPETTNLILDLTKHAMGHITNETSKDVLKIVKEEDVKSAINNNDKEIAKKVLKKVSLPAELMARISKEYNPEFYSAWAI
jgi:hypothetical protein